MEKIMSLIEGVIFLIFGITLLVSSKKLSYVMYQSGKIFSDAFKLKGPHGKVSQVIAQIIITFLGGIFLLGSIRLLINFFTYRRG